MRRVVVLEKVTRWECPNCDFTDVTKEAGPHTRYHTCAGLHGLSAPMVEHVSERRSKDDVRRRVQVKAKAREDYIGKEKGVQFDENGRPVMSIVTTREDGNDVVVLAPTAEARS